MQSRTASGVAVIFVVGLTTTLRSRRVGGGVGALGAGGVGVTLEWYLVELPEVPELPASTSAYLLGRAACGRVALGTGGGGVGLLFKMLTLRSKVATSFRSDAISAKRS